MDVFTKYGLLKNNGGIRKELGLGFNPLKNLVITGGWSKNVGLTFGAGIKVYVGKNTARE